MKVSVVHISLVLNPLVHGIAILLNTFGLYSCSIDFSLQYESAVHIFLQLSQDI